MTAHIRHVFFIICVFIAALVGCCRVMQPNIHCQFVITYFFVSFLCTKHTFDIELEVMCHCLH